MPFSVGVMSVSSECTSAAAEGQYQRVEWRGVLAQFLVAVEGEERDAACWTAS
jgi:hypothetical protein